MNTLNTETHSSKEIAEFSFEDADIKSIFYCKERIKSKLSLSSECVKTKLCKPRMSFTSHQHSSCGMMWYRTLRVKIHGSGLNPLACTTALSGTKGATRGVTVSMSAFLACHQCYCAGSSLTWGLNFQAVVCGIF